MRDLKLESKLKELKTLEDEMMPGVGDDMPSFSPEAVSFSMKLLKPFMSTLGLEPSEDSLPTAVKALSSAMSDAVDQGIIPDQLDLPMPSDDQELKLFSSALASLKGRTLDKFNKLLSRASEDEDMDPTEDTTTEDADPLMSELNSRYGR